MSIPLGTRVEPYTYSSPSTRLLFKPLHEVEGGGCWADVFLPKRSQPGGGLEQPERGWPVVIVVHGGAFTVGSTCEQPSEQIDKLLGAGLAVVDVEYRLAPHADITQMNADVLDAYRWVHSGQLEEALLRSHRSSSSLQPRREEEGVREEDRRGASSSSSSSGGATSPTLLAGGEGRPSDEPPPKIDGERISLVGYSAGAYLAAMLAHAASPPPKAVLLFYGLFDLVIAGTTPRSAIYLGLSDRERALLRQVEEGLRLTSADHERERPGPRRMWMTAALVSDALLDSLLPAGTANTAANRAALSPLHLATAAYPPTFLVAPQLDTLISPVQSFLMAERLAELGVETVVRRANYAVHAFDRKGGKENLPGGQWWDECTLPGLDFLIART